MGSRLALFFAFLLGLMVFLVWFSVDESWLGLEFLELEEVCTGREMFFDCVSR